MFTPRDAVWIGEVQRLMLSTGTIQKRVPSLDTQEILSFGGIYLP